MASSSSVQQFQQPFQCKQCGVPFNSAESLDVHLQYHHKDNWSGQAGSSSEETNNNMTKGVNIKREFSSNSTIAAADSSELQKKSPDYNRHTPEGIFGHPPTPQSYQSASSPYQNAESSAFSPGFQNFPGKSEGHSPAQPHFQSQNSFSNYSEQQFFGVDSHQYNNQEGNSNKAHIHHVSYRYHPYINQSSQNSYERIKTQAPAPPSSPAYPPQPTPSPSPKQCDKCGYVCESAAQLIEHNTLSHPSTPQVGTQYPHNQHFMFEQQQIQVKTEENASQSEILDLDSQKVVHNEWEDKESEKRSNGDHIQHSVSGMLNSWPSQQSQPNMFQNEHNNMFMSDSGESKMFQRVSDNKMFVPNDQKLFQSHQNFMNNGVTSTDQELGNTPSPNQSNYRPFENLPSQPPVISSSTPISVPNNTSRSSSGGTVTKSGSWKSNEARRPKTYNCTACNKWFTSSGHLKRHYNTTLHKNAVKSSGQPDPATMPISAHHHPARDSACSKNDSISSNSPIRDEPRNDDSMGSFERINPMPGMIQHPPNGPYDRQGPIPPMHSPMAPSPLGSHSPAMMNPNFSQISNGSPPNGEAGLSPTSNLDSRGLLAIGSPNSMAAHPTPHGFSPMMAPHQSPMMHPMDVTTNQYQMYPNEYAPHVTQATDTNNLSTIGEYQFGTISTVVVHENQPLPSFEQIQAHRFGLGHGLANVGGQELVTAPYYYTTESYEEDDDKSMIYHQEGNEYKLAIVTTNDHQLTDENNLYSPSSNTNNNNNDESSIMSIKSEVEIKFDPEEFNVVTVDSIKNNLKLDYEESTNSPLVSSTVKSVEDSKTKCFDCDKVFNRPCYLTQHNKTCHMGDKPFKCTRCGKRFSSEEIYKEHIKKHAGEKPHKCEICPKQFNHKTDLRRHMCCHTGRKPYTCETCGKGFIRKDHMIKHTETHLRKVNKSSAMKG